MKSLLILFRNGIRKCGSNFNLKKFSNLFKKWFTILFIMYLKCNHERIITWNINFIITSISSISLAKQSSTIIRISSIVSQSQQTTRHKWFTNWSLDIRFFMVGHCQKFHESKQSRWSPEITERLRSVNLSETKGDEFYCAIWNCPHTFYEEKEERPFNNFIYFIDIKL